MIKKWIRWGATIGLIGSVTLTTWLSPWQKALALPTEQIVKTLQAVPVFAIVDDQGLPLVRVISKDNKNQSFSLVFMDKNDADNAFAQLQQKSPDVAKKVKVRLVPLSAIYKFAENLQNKPDGLIFVYVPTQKEVDEAKKIITAEGQQYKGGVPLFVVRGGKEQGYVTISHNNQMVIPIFFDIGELQKFIEQFKKEKPDLANTVKIEVVSLEGVMDTLKKSDNQKLPNIILIPSEDSLKAAAIIQNEAQTTTSNPAPTTTPKK